MEESDIREKIHHALQHSWWYHYHFRDAVVCNWHNPPRIVVKPLKGRADLICNHPILPGAHIECKITKDQGFDTKLISSDQRKSLAKWGSLPGKIAELRGEAPYTSHAYLGLGIIRQHGKVEMIEQIYVIPWHEWLAYEKLLNSNTAPVYRDEYKRTKGLVFISEKFDNPKYKLIKSPTYAGDFEFHPDHWLRCDPQREIYAKDEEAE